MFQRFFNKSILINRVRKMLFLKLKHKEENLNFWNKKLKKRKYYYNFNKYNSKKVIIKDKLF